MNIRVVDDRKKLLGEGRDWLHWCRVSQQFTGGGGHHSEQLERVNVTRWDFDDLPTEWRGKSQARRYWPTPR